MQRRRWIPPVVIAVGAALAGGARAGDESGTPPQRSEADYEAAAEAWEAARTPAEAHKRFEYFAGDWKSLSKHWSGPGEPIVSEGSAHFEVVMGGRYLRSTYRATMMGMPFEGFGIDGFDKVTGKYFSFWIDNFGTGYMISEGEPAPDGEPLVETGRYHDPTMGEVACRFVTSITAEDSFTLEMYLAPPGQEEFRTMEVTYTRQSP